MIQSRAVTLLMTRPLPQARAFADSLLAELPEMRVIFSPVLEIEAIDLPEIGDERGLVFTSQNAVRIFSGKSDRRELPAFCLGERTTEVARHAGFPAEQVGHNAETLVEFLPGRNPPIPLLHLHGEHTLGDVAKRLTQAGYPCREATIYRQKPVPLNAEAKAEIMSNSLIILPIFSPRTARILSEQLRGAAAPLAICWMSDAVRDAWFGPSPVAEQIAASPDATALGDAVLGLIATADRLERSGPAG